MRDDGKIARWTEAGKPKQKKCKTAKEAQEVQSRMKAQASQDRNTRMQRTEKNLPLEGLRKDVVSADPIERADGRSASIGIGGVVISLGAQALSAEEAKSLKAADHAASRLENLYARTYTDVLLATGKSEGWTEEEEQKAHKAAALQFKAALPRCSGGEQRDIFVTCVTAGIALSVFAAKEASQLLYAAQVMATGRKPR